MPRIIINPLDPPHLQSFIEQDLGVVHGHHFTTTRRRLNTGTDREVYRVDGAPVSRAEFYRQLDGPVAALAPPAPARSTQLATRQRTRISEQRLNDRTFIVDEVQSRSGYVRRAYWIDGKRVRWTDFNRQRQEAKRLQGTTAEAVTKAPAAAKPKRKPTPAPTTARKKTAPAKIHDAPKGRVFGYARVSTTMQAQEGESLDVQQRQIEGYAMQHGLTVEKVFVERGVSGSQPLSARPEGSMLLQGAYRGDVIITPKLDRMFRSALDALGMLAWLKDEGIALHMIDLGGDTTTNGVSKLVFTILSAVAEAERDRTRERVAEVKRDQKQRGRYLGGLAPFGFTKGSGGELVPVPEHQKAIKKMIRLRQQGESLRAIADKLKADGVQVSHMGVAGALKAVASR